MKELIRWLRDMEHTVGEIYSRAAVCCDHDPELKEFLEHLAEDEAWHYHVMASAEEHWGVDFPKAVVALDPETKEKIKNLQEALIAHINEKTVNRETFVEIFVELELNEWNDIFRYVANYLQQSYKEFAYPSRRIQSHLREIELFLMNCPGGPEKLKKLKEVPAIWTENVLIVDDEPIITQVLKSLLSRDGNIQVAENGRKALELIRQTYFKLIVSDIDMPLMDGISFYRQAVEDYSSLKNRFLFVSGFFSAEKMKFIRENNLPFMEKPLQINHFRRKCLEILLKP
jgi:two-component system chemotaxis response regulator CheY